jgi:hypothetical protein
MAQRYKAADERLKEVEGRSFLSRVFRLLLLPVTSAPDFDSEHGSLEDVRGDRQQIGDVALRTQVIPDPTRPFGLRDRILQLYVVESSRDRVRRNDVVGVLYEVTDGEEVPLLLLSKSDVRLTVSGEGFAVPLPYNTGDPEPAAPEPMQPPIPSGEPGPPAVATGAERITSENVGDLPDAEGDADADDGEDAPKRRSRKTSKR